MNETIFSIEQLLRKQLDQQLVVRVLASASLSEADRRTLACDCLEHMMYEEIYPSSFSSIMDMQPTFVLCMELKEWIDHNDTKLLPTDTRTAIEWLDEVMTCTLKFREGQLCGNLNIIIGGDDGELTFLNKNLIDFIQHSTYRLLAANMAEGMCENLAGSLVELRREACLEISDEDLRDIKSTIFVASTNYHAGFMDTENFINRMLSIVHAVADKYDLYIDDDDL